MNNFERLMATIYAAGAKMNSYESSPRSYGTDDLLYMTEVHLIDTIGSGKYLGITEIARATGKTKGAIAQTIDKLVSKGLLEKTVDPQDTRRRLLELTERGKIVFKVHREKDRTAFERYLSRLEDYSDEDYEKCAEIISKIFKIQNVD